MKLPSSVTALILCILYLQAEARFILTGARLTRSHFCLISSSVTAVLPTKRLFSCAAECAKSPSCMSFGFMLDKKVCRLSSTISSTLESCQNGGEVVYEYGCPEGHILNPISVSCIHVGEGLASWYEAKLRCEDESEYLAVFPTMAELTWLSDFISNENSPAVWKSLSSPWIGLNLVDGFCTWQGRDRSVVQTSSELWDSGEPEDGYPCSYFYLWDGKLVSDICEVEDAYICESSLLD